ncbi:rhodanese-like domain-containing protein [Fodinibius sp.]|uniref:rhodanese-like domain-containing protein n=1 Tax=Fodinibius sp. TaxID=1872440 RepID=UPI0035648FB1
MKEITVQELKRKIDNEENVFLLDVREPFEQYQSKIAYDNSILIPLGKLRQRLDEIADKKDQEVVCLCRSGSRSAEACKLLEKEGFTHAMNLKGGINQWARDIDNSLPVY